MTKYHDLHDEKKAGFVDWIPVLSVLSVILLFVIYSTEFAEAMQ